MKKISFLLISMGFLFVTDSSVSEVTQYLQCSFKENSTEKNFYWSNGSDNTIQRWVSGEPNSAMNMLVMNDKKILLGMKLEIPWVSLCLIKKQCDKVAPCFREKTKFSIDGSANAAIWKKISF